MYSRAVSIAFLLNVDFLTYRAWLCCYTDFRGASSNGDSGGGRAGTATQVRHSGVLSGIT